MLITLTILLIRLTYIGSYTNLYTNTRTNMSVSWPTFTKRVTGATPWELCATLDDKETRKQARKLITVVYGGYYPFLSVYSLNNKSTFKRWFCCDRESETVKASVESFLVNGPKPAANNCWKTGCDKLHCPFLHNPTSNVEQNVPVPILVFVDADNSGTLAQLCSLLPITTSQQLSLLSFRLYFSSDKSLSEFVIPFSLPTRVIAATTNTKDATDTKLIMDVAIMDHICDKRTQFVVVTGDHFAVELVANIKRPCFHLNRQEERISVAMCRILRRIMKDLGFRDAWNIPLDTAEDVLKEARALLNKDPHVQIAKRLSTNKIVTIEQVRAELTGGISLGALLNELKRRDVCVKYTDGFVRKCPIQLLDQVKQMLQVQPCISLSILGNKISLLTTGYSSWKQLLGQEMVLDYLDAELVRLEMGGLSLRCV